MFRKRVASAKGTKVLIPRAARVLHNCDFPSSASAAQSDLFLIAPKVLLRSAEKAMNNRFESSSENRPEQTRSEQEAGAQAHSSNPHEATVKSGADKGQPPAGRERRSRRRALISAPVRVRQLDVTHGGPDEVSATLDVSRSGILFASARGGFEPGMEVAVTFPYSQSLAAMQTEQAALVARVSDMGDGRRAVAVAFDVCKDPEIVDSSGHKLVEEPRQAEGLPRPLILVMDADAALRVCLKTYLKSEGYEVIAVGTSSEARAVLDIRTPALLIAEIEGDDLPGYDLCAHVKSTARLQAVPVILLTRSAYPSDYANAHSLGAIVCMAKPYRQERLGHVVKLLVPPLHAKHVTAPPRPGDPKRRPCTNAAQTSARSRIRFIR